jgi:hypothetical protein
MSAPQSLIINSPFEPPTHHRRRAGGSRLELAEGRRPAGYEVFDTRNKTVRGVEMDEARLAAFHGTVSLPFPAGDNRKIAVKIVDDRGI